MRNPKWHRDEIILALDLYFDGERGSIDDKNSKVKALSDVLNKLPIFSFRPDEARFRNANGVTLKLANFLALDPKYHGKGMSAGSKLDKEIFKEFYNKQEKLKAIANEIKNATTDAALLNKLYQVEEDDQTKNDVVLEGQVLYKLHKVRERDAKIVAAKKDQVRQASGKLACEACVFEFERTYGEIGKNYVECHHRTPLSNFKVASYTRLDDLALVCSNCHRMLHRSIDNISVEDLRMRIVNARI